ncbi:beta-propeller domain-containing protein [Acetanaerobacterium elongatum]|uniref:Beta propeller domain-containing protein n=1 Tax=Acetanaerobacterium elongatum TaxID=258515 RepID=A0A1H0CNZ2_9FIRM|nr:beta-propeller domain-containing protein [Acetanaerobacterium elongatum]SDN59586.1 Beta propeller domain-containing protein [Acetanaerobacterium elongatum]
MPRYNPEKDIDFLRQKMNRLNEDILPSARISPEILVQKLDDEQPAPANRKVFFTRRRLAFALCAGFVCCIALVYAALQPMKIGLQGDVAPSTEKNAQAMGIAPIKDEAILEAAPAADAEASEALAADESYQSVRTALEQTQIENQEKVYTAVDGIPSETSDKNPDEPEGSGGKGGGGGGGSEAGFAAKVSGSSRLSDSADADIIQADDRYIYYTTGTTVKIAETSQNGKLTLSSEIDVSKEDRYVIELFVQGNNLTLLCNNYAYIAPGASEEIQSVGTTVEMYDITNRQSPVKKREYTQEGEYLTAKVSSDTLYMVSVRRTFEYSGVLPVCSIVPSYYDSATGMGGAAPLSSKDIILPEAAGDNSYATVTAMKLYDASAPASTKAVLGGACSAYIAPGGVYLINSAMLAENQTGTRITKLAYNGSEHIGITEAKVAGRVPDGTAMDESDGTLRMVTTSQNQQGKNAVNLYVFGRDLSIAGSTQAPNDQTVYAARFYGGTAYVSAYGEQDPLLVFDLSDALHPKLLGDVKVKGFSTSLHPVGDQTVVGLGYLTALENGETVRKGLQLTLFDISDKQKPVVKKAITLGQDGSYSEAVLNLKSLYYSTEKQMIGFSAVITRLKEGSNILETAFSGYYLYSLKDNSLALLGKLPNASEQPEDAVHRGLCIGNYLYTASDKQISSYDLSSFNKADTLKW